MPFYLLLFYSHVTSFFKERLCRNRGVSGNIPLNSMLQLITNSSCNTFPLIISMDKQMVKVARFVNISKPHDNVIINRNNAEMFLKQLVPCF